MTRIKKIGTGFFALALAFAAGTKAFAQDVKAPEAKDAPKVVEKKSDRGEKPLFGADLYLKEGLIDEATAKKINDFEEKRRAEWMEKAGKDRKEQMEKWQKSMEEKSAKGESPKLEKRTPPAGRKPGMDKGRKHGFSKEESASCGCCCHESDEPETKPMKKPAKKSGR